MFKNLQINKEEERTVNHLILHAFSEKQIGLMDGQMGIALAFYLYGRKWKSDIYTRFADELLNDLLGKLTTQLTTDFASGFCGIGWGLEYLMKENFICCTADVCEELDLQVMATEVENLDASQEKGLEGLLHYVLAHVYGCVQRSEKLPFTPLFLERIYQQTNSLPETNGSLPALYNYWYKTRKGSYTFDWNVLIAPVHFSGALLSGNRLGLRGGLAGYLITTCL